MRQPTPSTLAAALWPGVYPSASRPARYAVLAFAGALALAVSARVQIPFYPVPLTLQTLVVLVLGAAYGGWLAGVTVALYLLEGLAGLPVFAGAPERGLGLAYMMGPTGGFLIGFLVAAIFVGLCAQRGWDRSIAKLLGVMIVGHAIIFAFGLGWLAHLFGWPAAWAGGAQPFILATLVKTVLAALALPTAWRLAQRSEPTH
jgi:biotin transport system substrate-specific component